MAGAVAAPVDGVPLARLAVALLMVVLWGAQLGFVYFLRPLSSLGKKVRERTIGGTVRRIVAGAMLGLSILCVIAAQYVAYQLAAGRFMRGDDLAVGLTIAGPFAGVLLMLYYVRRHRKDFERPG